MKNITRRTSTINFDFIVGEILRDEQEYCNAEGWFTVYIVKADVIVSKFSSTFSLVQLCHMLSLAFCDQQICMRLTNNMHLIDSMVCLYEAISQVVSKEFHSINFKIF